MGKFFASPVKLPKTELPQYCVHPTIYIYSLFHSFHTKYGNRGLNASTNKYRNTGHQMEGFILHTQLFFHARASVD